MSPAPRLADFPFKTFDKLRYGDTDRQGHVNNAVFATFLETGRVEFLVEPHGDLNDHGCEFVIASLQLDFVHEMRWPGRVDIGTRVVKIGTSSFTLEQGLFQTDRCVATATTVIVQMNEQTRRSQPLGDVARKKLADLMPRSPV